MSQRPHEISSIIKEQIKSYKSKIEMKETGTVILVGDGIAKVYGLRDCMSSELLEFEDGSFGMAQNLETETVSVAICPIQAIYTRVAVCAAQARLCPCLLVKISSAE